MNIRKKYIKPESVVVPYKEPLMQLDDASRWTSDNFAKEDDFFDSQYDDDPWKDAEKGFGLEEW